MPPSKTDTYRIIIFKKSYGASERLSFKRQPAHPKTKNKTQTLIKKTKLLIHKKKKEKKKKKANPKTQIVFPDKDSYSL